MKIPKGTAKIIFQETNQIYIQNFGLWIKTSLPWWAWSGVVYFFYLDNSFIIRWLDEKFPGGFLLADSFITVGLLLMLVMSLVATLLMFDVVGRGQKVPSVFRVYTAAFKLLYPLLILKIRYLWRIFCRLWLLIVPGIFALTDGFAYYMAFLYDHKDGQEAILLSEKVVRVNRARYWDYLLMGFLMPCLLVVPFIIFLNQCAYLSRLNQLSYLNLPLNGLKYVGLYFSAVYFLLFHSRVYAKFKTFLT